MRRQLRQGLQAGQHGDGDELTGLVVQDAGVEDVSEDEPAQDAHQLRIVVGRTLVTWPEQALVRHLGMRLTIGDIRALEVVSHGGTVAFALSAVKCGRTAGATVEPFWHEHSRWLLAGAGPSEAGSPAGGGVTHPIRPVMPVADVRVRNYGLPPDDLRHQGGYVGAHPHPMVMPEPPCP